MQGNPTSEAVPTHSAATELLAQLSGQAQSRNSNPGQLASYLQQQGAMSTGLNLADPSAQAHVWSILSQMGATPGSWGAANQASSSQNLENLLAQISRQPEVAASLPSLLNSLAGSLGTQQQQAVQLKGPDGSAAAAQPDALQGSYTAQLYGAPSSGLGSDGEGKGAEGGSDLVATGSGDQDPTITKAQSVKCAKEKNRQAQRRFRERQKGLIQDLKQRADTLQKTVEDQRRQIETLEKENQVLKVILQDKNKT